MQEFPFLAVPWENGCKPQELVSDSVVVFEPF